MINGRGQTTVLMPSDKRPPDKTDLLLGNSSCLTQQPSDKSGAGYVPFILFIPASPPSPFTLFAGAFHSQKRTPKGQGHRAMCWLGGHKRPRQTLF